MKEFVITDAGYSPVLGVRARILVKFLLAQTKAEDGCLIWAGARRRDGYGVLTVRSNRAPDQALEVQRLSWSLSRGRPIPEHVRVAAQCGSSLCIRPDHLVTL